jgi:hypothetical protein
MTKGHEFPPANVLGVGSLSTQLKIESKFTQLDDEKVRAGITYGIRLRRSGAYYSTSRLTHLDTSHLRRCCMPRI